MKHIAIIFATGLLAGCQTTNTGPGIPNIQPNTFIGGAGLHRAITLPPKGEFDSPRQKNRVDYLPWAMVHKACAGGRNPIGDQARIIGCVHDFRRMKGGWVIVAPAPSKDGPSKREIAAIVTHERAHIPSANGALGWSQDHTGARYLTAN